MSNITNSMAAGAEDLDVPGVTMLMPGAAGDWQGAVDRYLEGYLKDPMSAVKTVTRGPRRAVVHPDVWRSWAGAAICYSINAKNSYGAYTGTRPFLFVVDNGEVVGMLTDKGDEIWNGGIIRRECSLAADSPSAN